MHPSLFIFVDYVGPPKIRKFARQYYMNHFEISRGLNYRDREIVMILMRLDLPYDLAHLTLCYVRASFRQQYVAPIAEKLEIVLMIKRVLKPSPHWEGLVEIDVASIDTGWDVTHGRRNLSTLFRYCSMIERIVNGWEDGAIISRPSAALVLMVWQKRKRLILSNFTR